MQRSMMQRTKNISARMALLLACLACRSAWSQSPFDTGASALVDFMLTIGTPIAILVVAGIAIAAMVGRLSWGIAIGCIVGIAALFGSPQIVAWVRGMFAV